MSKPPTQLATANTSSQGASVTSAPTAIQAPPGAKAMAAPSTRWHRLEKRFT